MPTTVVLEVFAIRQTNRETGDYTWRTDNQKGASYPALFTSIIKANAYARVLRSEFKDEFAFTVQKCLTMDLQDFGEPGPVVVLPTAEERPHFSDMEVGPGGKAC